MTPKRPPTHTREPGRASSLARSGRTVGAAAPAGPFGCDILLHRRGRRMCEAECCYSCSIGKSGAQDPMSARWWLPRGHQPGSGRATRELGQRHLAFVAAPKAGRATQGSSMEGSGRSRLKVERFHAVRRYSTFGNYGMVWYQNVILGNYRNVSSSKCST